MGLRRESWCFFSWPLFSFLLNYLFFLGSFFLFVFFSFPTTIFTFRAGGYLAMLITGDDL